MSGIGHRRERRCNDRKCNSRSILESRKLGPVRNSALVREEFAMRRLRSMTAPTYDDQDSGTRICHACIGDRFLAAEIESSREADECTYCGESRPSMTIEELADRVETAFADHYTRTSSVSAKPAAFLPMNRICAGRSAAGCRRSSASTAWV